MMSYRPCCRHFAHPPSVLFPLSSCSARLPLATQAAELDCPTRTNIPSCARGPHLRNTARSQAQCRDPYSPVICLASRSRPDPHPCPELSRRRALCKSLRSPYTLVG